MTTNSRRTDGRDRFDPMIEALLKELIATKSHAKAAEQSEDAVATALTEEILSSLMPSPSADAEIKPSSMEAIMLAALLAPALADALAPVLADALAPALLKALNEVISLKGVSQSSPSKKSSDK